VDDNEDLDDSIGEETSCDCCGEGVARICVDGDDEVEDYEGQQFARKVAMKVTLPGMIVADNVDTACWSIWMAKATFEAAGGKEFRAGGEAMCADGGGLDVAGRGRIDIMLWGRLFPRYEVRVMKSLSSRMLLGRGFMLRYGMELDLRRGLGSFVVENSQGAARFSGTISYGEQGGSRRRESAGIQEVEEAVCNAVEEADIRDAIEAMDFPGFGEQSDQESLRRVLLDNWEVFRPTIEIIKGPDFSIKLQGGADVSRLNRVAFHKSPLEKEVEEVEMRKLLERGIVEPSLSPCCTSNVMVPKKKLPDGTSGGLRVTADMRAGNSVTVGDAFPTEDIGMILDWLAKKRWFSVADVKDGYWNVRLAEGSRYLTAVKTVVGLVQYTRMTMGLKNAGGFLQRLVNNVYAGLKGRSMQAYLDDIAVGSDTPAQHIADVRDMLERTKDARLRLKLAKSSFGKAEVELLGHKVSFGEVGQTTSIENVYNTSSSQRTPQNC
jgi:hypothetical protein